MNIDPFIKRYLSGTKALDKFVGGHLAHNFNKAESDKIIDQKSDLYFDRYGNIVVVNPASGEVIFSYTNPIINKPVEKLSRFKAENVSKRANFIFNFNKKWVLVKDADNLYSLVYNFIHTSEFADLFVRDEENAVSIFYDYCDVVHHTDPTCSCLPDNAEYCVNDVFGEYDSTVLSNIQSDPSVYEAVKNHCDRISSKCKVFKDLPTSFLNDYYTDVNGVSTYDQPINLTICEVKIQSGRDLTANSSKISQNCNGSGGTGGGGSGGGGVTEGGSGSDVSWEEIGVSGGGVIGDSASEGRVGVDGVSGGDVSSKDDKDVDVKDDKDVDVKDDKDADSSDYYGLSGLTIAGIVIGIIIFLIIGIIFIVYRRRSDQQQLQTYIQPQQYLTPYPTQV
jgi:uncharacterized membrane protein YgcG